MIAPKRNALQQLVYLLGLYRIYLKIYFRTLIEYRTDTWVALIGGLCAQASTLTFLTVIFQRIPRLAGWSYYELVFIFGLAATGRALNQAFLNVPYSLNGYIRSGMLDVFMIRPVGPLFQATGMSQEINGVGSALTGMVILIYAASHLELHWTFAKGIYVAVALISSMIIQLAVLLAIVVSAFWILEIRSIIYPVGWLYDFTRYPLQIFTPFIRGLLTYIIPFALGSFYPAAFLLRPHLYSWAGLVVPFVAILLFILTYNLWLFGLRRYSSASG
ncbi:MAG: hypothetical protein JWN30_2183 [Bacilli bacterium]|nr:hypothetical protein [Bacilli bacterium]